MFVVRVALDVHPERIDEFVAAIRRNSSASLSDEVGCLRFDVLRDVDRPTRFYFHEIYRDREAFERGHRGAAHYADWLDAEKRCVVAGSKSVSFAEPLAGEGVGP